MFQSIGLTELIVIIVVLVVLFGGGWFARAGREAGQKVRKKVLAAKWVYTSATGTNSKALLAEREYGQEAANEFASEYDDVVAEAKQVLVARLGASLSQQHKTPWPLSYRVVAAPEINAYALPGGFIFISERLLDVFGEDHDAVAFVLAHEMAHVVLGHARDALERGLLLAGVTAKAAGLGNSIRALIMQGYSRDDELAADKYGVSLMKKAGFDSGGATRTLTLLGRLSPLELGPLEYLSSHTPANERLSNIGGQPSLT